MKKIIHIVPRKFSADSLERSFEFDNSIQGEIIFLNDNLSLGPISNLDTPKGILQRKKWWKKVSETSIEYNWLKKDLDESAKYEWIRKTLKRDVKMFFWMGRDAHDRLAWMKFSWELRKSNSSKIYCMDYPFSKIKNINGRPVPFKFIGLMMPEHIPLLKKYFRKVKKEEILKSGKAWEKISSSSSTIRIVAPKGEMPKTPLHYDDTQTISPHRKIIDLPENYFDDNLISRCESDFKKAVRVVGETMLDIDFLVGDLYLNHRLKELVRAGKLDSIGKLELLRDYQVKLKK